MNVTRTAQTSDEVRQQILDAAEERFRHYGYGKTTMVEIAKDVNMSAANLYRYFKNKQDIAADCAERCQTGRIETLRMALRAPCESAVERLYLYVTAYLCASYEIEEEQSKINELVDLVAREHSNIIHNKMERERALIAEILAQGNQSGEFDVPDVIKTATSVHASLMLFGIPLFQMLYPREALEGMAKDVTDLLIRGLARR